MPNASVVHVPLRPPLSRMAVLAALTSMCVLMAVLRLHTFDEPLERDITTYSVIADGLRSGRPLYADLWDHKPPAIHVTYAVVQVVVGSGNAAVYALGVMGAVLGLLAVYAAASTRREAIGLLAAALWTLYSGEMLLQANQPNTEVFINACLCGALAGFLRLRPRSRRLGLPLALAGLLLAAALYKQTCLLYLLGFGAVHVASARPSERLAALRQVAIMGGLVGVGGLVVVLTFVLQGTFDDFWQAVVVYNAHYAGGLGENLLTGLRPILLVPPILYPALPLLLVSLGGTVAAVVRRRATSRGAALLVMYGACNLFFIASSGKFFPHYYQVWLPVLCIVCAFSVHLATSSRRPPLATALATLLLVASAVAVLPEYSLDATEWSRRKYDDEFVTPTAVGRRLATLLEPGETVYELGAETEIYYYSGHAPPSGVLYNYPLVGPLAPTLSQRLVADLSRRLPDLLVVRTDHGLSPTHPVCRWLEKNYGPLPSADPPGQYVFMPRPGSALADRILHGRAQSP